MRQRRQRGRFVAGRKLPEGPAGVSGGLRPQRATSPTGEPLHRLQPMRAALSPEHQDSARTAPHRPLCRAFETGKSVMRSRRRPILRRLRIWRHRRIGIRCALVPALRPFLVLFVSICVSPLLPAASCIRLFLPAPACIGSQPSAPTHSARPDTFPEPVCRIYTGSRIENRLPLPISLSTEIVPPCASTNSFEMASPSPLPCTFVPGTRK